MSEAILNADGGPLDGTHVITISDDPSVTPQLIDVAFATFDLLSSKKPGTIVTGISPYHLQAVREYGLEIFSRHKHTSHMYQLDSLKRGVGGRMVMDITYVGTDPPHIKPKPR